MLSFWSNNMKNALFIVLAVLLLSTGLLGGCDYVTGIRPIAPGQITISRPDTILTGNQTEIEIQQKIIPLILSWRNVKGKYYIVSPEMNLDSSIASQAFMEYQENIGSIRQDFKRYGYDASQLLNELVEVNSKPRRLAIPSSINNGYLIDYNNQRDIAFDLYPDNGWDKFHEANPKVQWIISISWPVYDKSSGLVFLYLTTTSGWNASQGVLVLFKFSDEKLTELVDCILWYS
jgi:hypothetical protein